MSEPNLELQKAVRSRLVASSAVTSLVPATSIVDRDSLPVNLPSIILGEGQTLPGGDVTRNRHDVFLDLHVWFKEPGLEHSKRIAGAIREALTDSYWRATGYHVADLYVTSSRFLRDPDGEHSHAVIGLSAVVTGVAA